MESKKRKHPKSNGLEPKAKSLHVAEPLKLSELNNDVLIEVFRYLDAQDLINLVKMDEKFMGTCREAFRITYKDVYINLPLREGLTTTRSDYIQNAELLRYFGEQISKLQLIIDDDNPTDRRIYHLVVTTCRHTLNELHFVHPTTELKVIKCFTTLKTLNISHGSIDQSMCQFRKLFPMLENLNIHSVYNIANTMNLNSRIETLKSFALEFCYQDVESEEKIKMEDINAFIKHNPQLNWFGLDLDDLNIATDTPGNFSPRFTDGNTEQLMTVRLKSAFQSPNPDHSDALAQLKLPSDRIEQLEVATARLNPQLCSVVDSCGNLKTLKIGVLMFAGDNDPFLQEAWTNFSDHKLLTYLKIKISFFTLPQESHSKLGLSPVRPFLKRFKKLLTIKVKYTELFPFDEHHTSIRCYPSSNRWQIMVVYAYRFAN